MRADHALLYVSTVNQAARGLGAHTAGGHRLLPRRQPGDVPVESVDVRDIGTGPGLPGQPAVNAVRPEP
eukprot:6295581-Alexandrium_andersonii.AAC.1